MSSDLVLTPVDLQVCAGHEGTLVGGQEIAVDYAEQALRLQRESGWHSEPELLTGIIVAGSALPR